MTKAQYYLTVCFALLVYLLSTDYSDAAFSAEASTVQNRLSEQRADEQISEGELAQILAPIALYPDSLLSHIIIASTYPVEVVQAHRWREENQHLRSDIAVEEALTFGWDPSVVALVAFPNVLRRMHDDLSWTTTLGDTFITNQARVFESIQNLRLQAENSRSLEQLDNMHVSKRNQNIVIEPLRPEIIYVPYYDPRTVYGHWQWHRHPPVYWDISPSVSFNVSFSKHRRFHWSTGVHINFNYFFSAFNWHKRHIVINHQHRSNYYRTPRKIYTSYGAKRWQHKSSHRRGYNHKNAKAKSRHYGHKATSFITKHGVRNSISARGNHKYQDGRQQNPRHHNSAYSQKSDKHHRGANLQRKPRDTKSSMKPRLSNDHKKTVHPITHYRGNHQHKVLQSKQNKRDLGDYKHRSKALKHRHPARINKDRKLRQKHNANKRR